MSVLLRMLGSERAVSNDDNRLIAESRGAFLHAARADLDATV
jgi:hypothetical protein